LRAFSIEPKEYTVPDTPITKIEQNSVAHRRVGESGGFEVVDIDGVACGRSGGNRDVWLGERVRPCYTPSHV